MKSQGIVSVDLVAMKIVLKTLVLNGEFCRLEHLAMLGDIFGCHNWGGSATGTEWAEVRDAAELPTMHSPASHKTEFSSP